VATLVTSCLEDVITEGTGTAAAIGRPAAGKTGTTTSYRDAWFVGYTPDLVTAVWVGYPDEQKPMTDVHGIKVTGGSLPAKIWAAFMKQAVKGTPVSDFPQPSDEGWVEVEVCSESHLLPTDLCPSTVKMLFRADQVPTEECHIHQPKETEVPDVVGYTLADAEAVLAQAGFKVTALEDTASLQPKGTVVEQTPTAGSTLLQGEVVTLIISARSTQSISVPDVTGMDIADAAQQLSRLGLAVNESSRPDSSRTGIVLEQDVEPGTSVDPGTVINLTTSSGPESTSST
jgi:penicillin-binding protein 1A